MQCGTRRRSGRTYVRGRRDGGQALIEYVIILANIALVSIAILSFGGRQLSGLYGCVSNAIQNQTSCSGSGTATAANTWNKVTSYNANANDNELNGVTCVNASDCWAVGFYNNGSTDRALIENYCSTCGAGSTLGWGNVAAYNDDTPGGAGTQNNQLWGVTCVGASFCMAVGWYNNGTNWLNLIEYYNGLVWAQSPSSVATFEPYQYLQSVTCYSTSFCMAVGQDTNAADNASYPLLMEYTGSWSLLSSGAMAGDTSNFQYMSGVSCMSTSNCIANGFYSPVSGWQTLVLQWNSASGPWTFPATQPPDRGPTSTWNQFTALWCVSATDCWGTAYSDTGTAAGVPFYCQTLNNCQTLYENYNGTTWSIVPSPNTSTAKDNVLAGVTCVDASDCWAAGFAFDAGSFEQTLINYYNGASWTLITPTYNTAANQHNYFNAVACASVTECWAVGSSGPGAQGAYGATNQTLIEEN